MIERFRAPLSLLVGDLVVICAVLTWGTVDHHGVAILGSVGYVAETLAPFVVGWLVVAAIAGVYVDRPSSRATLARLGVAWIAAAVVGAGIRATPLFHGSAEPIFVAVVAGTVGIALLGWRTVALRYHRRS
jgi:hypothetical protein